MDEELLPIVSLVIVADKGRCPPGYLPILKSFDDGSDADLYKDSGWFSKSYRYLAVSRAIVDHNTLEVVTDLLVINEREAIPAHFISIDYTVDSNEKALRKKFLCARFTPRNDALDAVTDIVILSRTKRPPRGYTSAGEVDGMTICFKVATIPETYARLNHSKSNPTALYPNISHKPSLDNSSYRHSTSDLEVSGVHNELNHFTIKMPRGIRGIDGVPFKLSPALEKAVKSRNVDDLPELLNPEATLNFEYNFATERSCLA